MNMQPRDLRDLDQSATDAPPNTTPVTTPLAARAHEPSHWGKLCLFLIVVLAAATLLPRYLNGPPVEPPVAIVTSNGRIEAERVDIATKAPGRLKDVLVKEGDTVTAGQALARMDTAELEAQIREAEAAVRQAEQQLDQARALVAQRESERALAGQDLDRSKTLAGKGYATREKLDQRRAAMNTADAAVRSAEAQVALSKAMIEAAAARVDSLKVNLTDAVLTAPRAGRIQYRLAQPGEVLAAGGKVLTLLDLTDVYMTVFLPTSDAGRLTMGAEARIIFDAAPQYVVPANVSFIAADAQFTPKYVETKTERDKLMFRVKVQLQRDMLEQHAALVKTGLPGIAHIKIVSDAPWPDALSVRLPR